VKAIARIEAEARGEAPLAADAPALVRVARSA
jgi:hypothetical protein